MKIAILGAGNIASTMAKTLAEVEGVSCYAVAAREYERAKAFADEYGFEKAYGSYEEMVQDSQVDLVYIATPHSHHYAHAKLCLEHGKHVLCEKAFTINVKQAEEIIALAKSKKLLLAEAIWTRYMPSREKINEVIASGIIGKVNTLNANLGYVIAHKPRVIEPSLAGGALLDIGIYTINFALMAFGDDIEEISSTATLADTGVDLQNSITFKYRDGKMAILNSTTLCLTDREGVISGDKGYMVVENINNCQSIRVFDVERNEIAYYTMPKQITGFEYEVMACVKAIQEGKVECEEMPHSETIRVLRIMDDLRKQWGVKYPGE